ncbi:hypothetical protein [Ponticaulis sp.]|uniref:hypothetical protein n=1 Tax=Ponticaulis sp. TaxID=2020902 RepID=UPI000C468DA5|nr:hypothetical protein [Ponticaulis sp.]MAJ10665.1 hypothetical protein [Ponticaulis sp.]HBH89034.1 hypothetical protein [Hyphomonadaceae bacterium]|tara:strand:- start:6576 stop:7109 length:534 start_codon:yes stop_codon:yes gene_type:complete
MNRTLTILACLIPALAILVLWGTGYSSRALNWWSLSKSEIIDGARAYRDRYDNPVEPRLSNAYACLYAVSCDGERARLVPVTDPENWDFEATRSTIWNRRFSDVCPGRTANFGLHWIDASGADIPDHLENAYWSFHNDRFVMRLGRFNSGSFSEEPWQRCTPETAILSPLHEQSSAD